ncbi:MAG: hypothetical protein V4731_01115 [Pseudomonadota bacterium]
MTLLQTELSTLTHGLQRFKSGECGAAEFSRLASSQQALLAALPSRFREVLDQLLTRLESSALFTEESCSFSQQELIASLAMWVDKAGAHLQSSRLPESGG